MSDIGILSRWLRRLRSYVLAFVPPPRNAGITDEILNLDAPGMVRMFQFERQKLFGRTIEISTPRIDMIAYRDSAETCLRIARARHVTWVDSLGRRSAWNSAWWSGARLLADILLAPLLWRAHVKRLTKLVQSKPIPVSEIAECRTGLYLRLDIIFGLVAGGAVAHTLGIANFLRRRLNSLTFVCFEPVNGLDSSVEQICVPLRFGLGRNAPVAGFEALGYHASMVRKLNEICRYSKPAFIYQRFCQGQYAGAWVAKQRNIPLILEYNGSELWIARHWGEGTGRADIEGEVALQQIEDANLAAASLIVVVSDVLRDQLIERGYDSARILVVPNGVNTDDIGPHLASEASRRHLGIPIDAPVIGFIGSLGYWHGVETLIEAFDLLLRENHDIAAMDPRLLVIGDGDRMPMVRAQVAERHLEGRVKLAGLVPQAEGVKFLSVSNVLVSPHVPNPDGSPFFGSPTKIFEYMALERPIVASRLGQIGTVLEDGRTALLTEPGSVAEVASAIARLIRQPALASGLGAAAREEAVKRHGWDSRVDAILSALSARADQKPRSSEANESLHKRQ